MDFFVGQKVVCVNDVIPPTWVGVDPQWFIKKGEIYTIRWVGMHNSSFFGNSVSLRLAGIVRTDGDVPFNGCRFKPVEYKAMSVFRKIVQDVTDGKTVEIVDA